MLLCAFIEVVGEPGMETASPGSEGCGAGMLWLEKGVCGRVLVEREFAARV